MARMKRKLNQNNKLSVATSDNGSNVALDCKVNAYWTTGPSGWARLVMESSVPLWFNKCPDFGKEAMNE